MGERFRIPPVITGSTWRNVFDALWRQQPRGASTASDLTVSPRITNREAVAIVRAVRTAVSPGWPTWYLYAAAAYGWDPERDVLDLSEAQRDAIFDPDMGALMFQEIDGQMADLDSAIDGREPRMSLDAGAFDDPLIQGEVAQALRGDGAAPVITAFRGDRATKQQAPLCRDKRTGKARVARVACDPNDPDAAKRNKRRVIEPNTRQVIEVDCDNPDDCKIIDQRDGIHSLVRFATIVAVGAAIIYMVAPAALSGAIAGRVARNQRRGRRKGRN